MSEVVSGKLKRDGSKWKLTVENVDGTSKIYFLKPEVLAPGFTPDEQSETDVDFEKDTTIQKQPWKVRPKGQPWTGSEPKVATVDYQRGRQEPARGHHRNERENRIDRDRRPRTEREIEMTPEFHNPYNFIPAPPRKTEDEIDQLKALTAEQQELAKDLCERDPIGHDRYHQGYYTGTIQVRITTETPLLLPDTARMLLGNDQHKSFPIRLGQLLDSNGQSVLGAQNNKILVPEINPTAVKGMLRSAYEAITNSRMSVFRKHDDRLAYRMESTEGARSVPARIEGDKIVLYTGFTTIEKSGEESGKPAPGEPLCAAWIKTYDRASCRRDVNGKLLIDAARPAKHREEVWANISRNNHGRFVYWRVEKMALDRTKLPAASNGEKQVRGFVCVTGKNEGPIADTSSNIENKHDERLFFNENGSSGIRPFDLKFIEKQWDDLIKDYRREHDDGHGKLKAAPNASRRRGNRVVEFEMEWSRHIRETSGKELDTGSKIRKEALRDGSLLYVRLAEDAAGNTVIRELFPVIISRRIHDCSPAWLLNSSIGPAVSLEQLSPADRVFGWVGDQVKGASAYRGQLRIGQVRCVGKVKPQNDADKWNVVESFGEQENPNTWLPLNILGQPKPQQSRFYVSKDDKGLAQEKGLSNERAGYSDGKGLRGRKVYPHHRELPANYWADALSFDLRTTNSAFHREYRRRRKPDAQDVMREQRDSQNRSLAGWVRPKCAFDFTVSFVNLTGIELGALIWLLDLNQHARAETGEPTLFHRLGGGKPFGFGSVCLEIAGHEIRDGDGWRDYYQGFSPSAKPMISTDLAECAASFNQILDGTFSNVLRAFLRSAKGHETGLPTHYPRARQYKEIKERVNDRATVVGIEFEDDQNENVHPPPHQDGLAYEWFVANTKAELKVRGSANQSIEVYSGRTTIPGRHPLPDLVDDKGLPILPLKIGEEWT